MGMMEIPVVLEVGENLQFITNFLDRVLNIRKFVHNRVHGLSAAIKLGTPEPKFLQSGHKLTYSQ